MILFLKLFWFIFGEYGLDLEMRRKERKDGEMRDTAILLTEQQKTRDLSATVIKFKNNGCYGH